jgi:hypothetical protein
VVSPRPSPTGAAGIPPKGIASAVCVGRDGRPPPPTQPPQTQSELAAGLGTRVGGRWGARRNASGTGWRCWAGEHAEENALADEAYPPDHDIQDRQHDEPGEVLPPFAEGAYQDDADHPDVGRADAP